MTERAWAERMKEAGSRRNVIALEAERITHRHGSLEWALSNRAQNRDLRALVRPSSHSKMDITSVYTGTKDTPFLLNDPGIRQIGK